MVKALIESDNLKKIIKATGKFISKNDMRPVLQYIRLDFEQKSVVATARDGCRISTITVPCKSDEKFTAFIEPYLMPHMPKCDVLIEMVDNNCFINVEGRIVGYRQPESNLKYDIRKVSDDFNKLKCKFKYTLNKKFLMDVLKSIDTENEALTIKFVDNMTPAIFKSDNGLIGILPIRTRE